jgi:arylsulfatase A-like enzyme
MKRRVGGRNLVSLSAGVLAALAANSAASAEAQSERSPPNVVVIITDDQGYADISLNPHHPPEVSTPHMDRLARGGVFFRQAYISGNVCSPTRAGLMLGRYQQRVGVYTAGDGGRGFDPGIPLFPAMLPEEYVSTAIGKWHLGLDDDFPQLQWHALSRGFDECYKFMGRGAHDYFRLRGASGADDTGPLYRGKQRIDDEGYLTDRLTAEAVDFIDRHRDRSFFLYLAYNAVHAPQQAPPETIEQVRTRYPALSPDRQILMAMLEHLDRGIGAVVTKLQTAGLFEDTLLFLLTDNGGSQGMSADNSPLRGFKSSFYEGGIRTPFIVSWPARCPGGRTVDTPVISLDILPTVLEAVGAAPPEGPPLDGRSLLPLLTGAPGPHHDALYWSSGGLEGAWAVRRGDWKLHGLRDQVELVDLSADPAETTNLAVQHPAVVRELTALYEAWLEPMPPPITGGPKRWTPDVRPSNDSPAERTQRRLERRAGRGQPRRSGGTESDPATNPNPSHP